MLTCHADESSPRSIRCCRYASNDVEIYGLLPVGLSSCVHLCRSGLLSALLSITKRFHGKSLGLPLAACATSTISDAGHTGMPTSRLSGVSGGNLPLRANATSAHSCCLALPLPCDSANSLLRPLRSGLGLSRTLEGVQGASTQHRSMSGFAAGLRHHLYAQPCGPARTRTGERARCARARWDRNRTCTLRL
jgi:hypothetical protein